MTNRIVIVGGGLAAASAVEGARQAGYTGEIVVLAEERHPPYERPPLSKEILLGEQLPEDSYVRRGKITTELQAQVHVGTSALSLYLDPLAVGTSDRDWEADALLIATGARPRRLSVPGGQLRGIHYLRTIDDAVALRQALVPGSSVTVVGGGLIGLEVAAAAIQLECRVTLVEAEDNLLGNSLGACVGDLLTDLHQARGVNVICGQGVVGFGGSYEVASVELEGGIHLMTDTVVVGVGALPNDDLAAHAGLLVDNGVVVDEYCRTSHPAVYAAGDVAKTPLPLFAGVRLRTEHWQFALNQGTAAGANMVSDSPQAFSPVPWYWSHQYGVHLQVAGLPRGEGIRLTSSGLHELVAAYGVSEDISAVVVTGKSRAGRHFIRAKSAERKVTLEELESWI